MADTVNKATRSRIMASIKGSGTKMELACRPVLEALGFEYQPRGIFGNPDFAHREAMVAVFLDGCFWHGCPEHGTSPQANAKFWSDKVAGNQARAEAVASLLEGSGWRVIRAWEHSLAAVTKEAGRSRADDGVSGKA
jgi:DNA mismatch endonuclease (patch repair protein)